MEPIAPYRPGVPEPERPRPEEPALSEPETPTEPDRSRRFRSGFWGDLAEGLCWGMFFAGLWSVVWAAVFFSAGTTLLAAAASGVFLAAGFALTWRKRDKP